MPSGSKFFKPETEFNVMEQGAFAAFANFLDSASLTFVFVASFATSFVVVRLLKFRRSEP